MNPALLSEIEASNSRAAAARTSLIATTRNAATPVVATEAVGGAPSRVQTTQSAAAASSASSARATSSVSSRSSVTPSSSSSRAISSSSSSSVRPSSSSTSVRPTTSSTSSVRPSSSSRTVLTVTSTRATSSSTSSSAAATASAAAASQSSESTGLSTGAIAGLAVGVLFGLVILGSAIGWLYRKHSQRKYANAAPWSKIDDDVTPFPPAMMEKQHYLPPDEDIYGQSQAPVIGSRRALALARDNAFHHDGSMRPDSDYMMPRDNNMAGYGAGTGLGAQYGAYPAMQPIQSPAAYDYGRPAQGYGHDGGRAISPVTQDYDYQHHQQAGMAVTAPGNTRQLVGPGGQPQGYGMPIPAPVPALGPMAMGRPAPPRSDSEFADREEFMDLPKPTPAATSNTSSGAHMSQYSTYGLAYADSEPEYMPHTATTTGWAGDAKVPYSAAPTALPAIEPASPLMSGFDFQQKRQSQQQLGPIAATFASKYGQTGAASGTLPMYEDEDESRRQKRMYGEVAHAAGVMEPTTPHTADLSHSTNSYETASSFSAHDPAGRSLTNSTNSHRLPPAPPMPPMPTVNLTPPQPYQHGQPLSPLPEVQTPASAHIPLTSSSLMHGQEINPFDQHVSPDQSLLATPRAHALRPPHSAVSSTGATSFPSPSFPPPSPGGMSVPGSISDSPGNRRQSMFDADDAYGGI